MLFRICHFPLTFDNYICLLIQSSFDFAILRYYICICLTLSGSYLSNDYNLHRFFHERQTGER